MPTGQKSYGSLTAKIQHKVVLCITVLLWTTCNEHIIIPKKILQAGNLVKEK